MKNVLITSRNLIGDGLWISPAVRKYQQLNPETRIDLLTNHDHVFPIYHGMGIVWNDIYTIDRGVSEYDEDFVLGAGYAGSLVNKIGGHIAEGYAEILKVKLDEPYVDTPYGRFRALKPRYDIPENITVGDLGKYDVVLSKLENNLIIISPFSASCSSQEKDKNGKLLGNSPNKMLLPLIWLHLLQYLQTLGKIAIVGSRSDEDLMPVTWERYISEYYFGLPIPETAFVMKHGARLVVTVDNGMGHLAASQDAKHILFYPMCLGMNFIIPWGANNTIPIQMDPMTVSSDQILYAVKKSVRLLSTR